MFFSNVSPFPDINEGHIDLLPFLEASKGIVRFVELLGSVFTPVKYDINGNIEKLHKIHLSDEVKFLTLNDIIEFELSENGINKVGIDALLWLKRALEYVHVFLTCLVDESKLDLHPEDLSAYFNKAYEQKLKPFHGWFIQKIFGIMVHAAPSRKALMHLLAGEDECANEEQVLNDIETFTISLGSNLEVINNLYKEHNIDSNAKV